MLDYCYVVFSESMGAYKIGSTASGIQRWRSLKTKYKDVQFVMALGVSNRGASTYLRIMSDWIEGELHAMFAAKRIKNPATGAKLEWFKLADEDLDRIYSFRFTPINYPSDYRELGSNRPTITADGVSHQLLRIRAKRPKATKDIESSTKTNDSDISTRGLHVGAGGVEV